MRTASACVLLLALAGCAGAGSPQSTPPPVAPSGGDAPAPDTMRWLYGSGEAAAVSIGTYRALADWAIARAKEPPVQSVAMGLPDAPGGIGTVSCKDAAGKQKPLAAEFDGDETVFLNAGYEYWQTARNGNRYDDQVWREQWEARQDGAGITAVPGAVEAFQRMRAAGITMIINTNRINAATVEADVAAAGLGKVVHGDTLFVKGDDAMGSNKDGRRATIAARYCVIALAGDNLGDFADAFNERSLAPQERRALASQGVPGQLWGRGWFAIPNPVYGPSVKGSIDEVFAPDVRWSPPTPATAPDSKEQK